MTYWQVFLESAFLVLFLAFLEGILSVDNALVLALLTKHLPPKERRRALTYGLGGAIIFRLISLSLITYLMHWRWVRFVGGGYLIIIAIEHFIRRGSKDPEKPVRKLSFWKTVLLVELMDIAFAIDSILAAVAISSKFWVVFTGGMLGVVLMRFAASIFGRLLVQFPRFEVSAFLMIGIIGFKMVLEGFHLPGVHFESPKNPAFCIFWGSVFSALISGFRKK